MASDGRQNIPPRADITGCINDDGFGPSVRGCRADFDFTMKFEQIFLSALPSAIFIALSVIRLVILARTKEIVGGWMLRSLKLVAIATYAALELVVLGLTATQPGPLRDLNIAAEALKFISAIAILVLSYLEHSRSPRPSVLLNAYLLLTLIFDVARVRTLWLAPETIDVTVTKLATAALVMKVAVAVLEALHKTRWVKFDMKEHSPVETTGLYGFVTWTWVNRLLLLGYRKDLTMDDLYALDNPMRADRLGPQLAEAMEKSRQGKARFGIFGALARTLRMALLLPVGPKVIWVGFNFSQPFLIDATLSFLEKSSSTRDSNVGYGLIGAAILIYLGRCLSMAMYGYFHERSMWMARGALASAIFEKTMRARISVSDDSAALTLMSTDIEKIRIGMFFMHEFWSNAIEVAIASYLLYRSLGLAFLAPILVVLLSAGLATAVAKLTGMRQKLWVERTQTRVGMTSKVISNMKNIKIAGLALPIEIIVQDLRLLEINFGRRFRMIICWSAAIGYLPLFIAPVLTFAWTSETLTVTRIFTSFSYLLLLCNPLNGFFQGLPMVLAAVTSLKRIQAFLESDERQDFRKIDGGVPTVSSEKHPTVEVRDSDDTPQGPIVSIRGGSFGWEEGKNILAYLNLAISTSQLTLVVGPVASGKSTLCKVLLGEVPESDGEVVLYSQGRRIAYCDQTPFLTNETIRQNILGFSTYNKARYDEVIHATALGPDLITLPQADQTKIGSGGISLSGGQKQRVAIARALYNGTNLFVFDDVLSGLDANTEEQVFRRIFGPDGVLRRRNATVILCTHSVRHLPSADHIIALDASGKIVEQGSFHDLAKNEKYVHGLGIKRKLAEELSLGLEESSTHTSTVDDEKATISETTPTKETATKLFATGQATRARERKIYAHYYRSIGFIPCFVFLLFGLSYGFFVNWEYIWIGFWSSGLASDTHSNAYYLGLFALFQCIGLFSIFSNIYAIQQWMISLSGAALHNEALATVINAPLRFFTTTDNGVITNLFSQDITIVDGDLPAGLMNVALCGSVVLGNAAVLASSAPYLAIFFPFVGVALWAVQRFYLKTSKQLRMVDLEAKSPLYTHYLDTIKGVATIRAFGWVQDGIEKNYRQVDTSQRPAFLLAVVQQWLRFVLNCTTAVLGIVMVVMATQLNASSGITGASLVTLMMFGMQLTWMMRDYTLLETSLAAIDRLKTLSEKVKNESQPGEDVIPEKSWPDKGKIEIKGVSASYAENNKATSDEDDAGDMSSTASTSTELALRELDITIESGEKVAICGRSGSGKSSIILLLLKLLNPTSSTAENIFIDDVPLHKINRHALRQSIIAVPQETVFLPDGNSFKANLDPLDASSDVECRGVLEAVGLGPHVEDKGGLSAGMKADELSQGQRQLFSLARAILRRRVRSRGVPADGDRGILLLDEVSSSVDVSTDRAMQDIIRKEFEGYTIVMVSHRLNMVMEFDKAIVTDRGSIVEVGVPKELVQQEESRFKELWLISHAGNEH